MNNMKILEILSDYLVEKYIDSIPLSEETLYRIHFRRIMQKHGIQQLRKASSDKKRAFFNDLKQSWKNIKSKMNK